MAELEMINHMKKSLAAVSPKNKHSWGHRLREFFTEIAIIVFAVWLSIWLHEWSEHRHEQAAVNSFLNELYLDLEWDQQLYTRAIADCRISGQGYAYLAALPAGAPANPDSIARYQPYLFRRYRPVPTQGRYESYKNSGRINSIEYPVLESDILDLFESDLEQLRAVTDDYQRLQQRYQEYLILNQRRKGGSQSALAIYATDESANYAQLLQNTAPIVAAYDSCIVRIRKINSAIAEELDLKH